MNNKFFDNIEIPEIPKKNVWIVRAGKDSIYYNDFKNKSYISFGEESLENYKGLSKNEIKDNIKFKNPDDKQPGSTASKFNIFLNEMRVGDIVVTPGPGASEICFGLIESEMLNNDEIDNFKNKRKVKWIKSGLEKNNIEPKLLLGLHSPHSIFTVPEYLEKLIEIHMWNIFQRNGEITITYDIQEDKPHGIELINFQNSLMEFIQIYCVVTGEKLSYDDLEFKIRAQSKGKFVITGLAVIGILGGGVIVTGGEFKGKLKSTSFELEVDVKTNGMLDVQQEHNRHAETVIDIKDTNKKYSESIKKLKVKEPTFDYTLNSEILEKYNNQ